MSRFHQREVPGRVLTEFTNADALHPEMVALGVLHVRERFRSRAVQHRVVGSFLTLTVSARRLWACRLAHSSLTRRYKHLTRDLGGTTPAKSASALDNIGQSRRPQRAFAMYRGGQRRGRTADLPIFRSWENSSPNTVDVRDLH
jgi:hypothetical protein